MSQTESQNLIVASGAKHYRLRYGIMALMCLALGGWFIYDGFYAWPKQNRQVEEKNIQLRREGKQEERIPHNAKSVMLNKLLGVVLPPVGVALIVLSMYRSRGRYCLDGQTLHAPGHPPIALDQIRRIDKTRWTRKGIAVVDYEAANGQTRRFVLDDWVYERQPTDQILERIEAHIRALTGEAPAPQQHPPPADG